MKTCLVAFLILLSVSAVAAGAPNLTFGGAGELYVPFAFENAVTDASRMRIRSLELTAAATLDDPSVLEWPGLSAKLTLGADDQSGDLVFNIREGYVVASGLLNGLDLRAGKFFIPIGIYNQTRRSARISISNPRALNLFFTENGLVDTGADLNYHIGRVNLRAGFANGYRFDSGVYYGGQRPSTPTHFVRPSLELDLGHQTTLTVSADYLGRTDELGRSLRIAGADASLTSGDWIGNFEMYHRYQNPQSLPIVEDVGGYLEGFRKLNERFLTGLRLDVYKIPTLTTQTGENRKNLTYGVTPLISFIGRDHLRIDGSYTFSKETRDGDNSRNEQSVEFRLVLELGSIPRSRTPEISDPERVQSSL